MTSSLFAMRSRKAHRHADSAVSLAANVCAIFPRRFCAIYGRRLQTSPGGEALLRRLLEPPQRIDRPDPELAPHEQAQ
jgi:hypothetical protein